jgi:serine phosphatase RsbU (regulator of sigma subunit)
VFFFSDGVTEARSPAGGFFGEDRLHDFLEREEAAELPPPETNRRLIHDVLEHQGGRLQDDATMLFLEWRSGAAQSLSLDGVVG